MKRRVTREGRVNIPIDYLKTFGIKYNDYVDVSHNDTEIIIRKLPKEGFCPITNKVFPKNELTKIGETTVSKEGLKLLEDYFKDK